MMGIYPPGSVVQLNDERYAMSGLRQFSATYQAARHHP